MLKRYAITTEDLSKKNNPRSHVVPNRQVNTAHAFTQYLTLKKKAWGESVDNGYRNVDEFR